MKKADLQSKTIKVLTAMAQKLGITKPSVKRKDDLIAEILTAEKVNAVKAARGKRSTIKKTADEVVTKTRALKSGIEKMAKPEKVLSGILKKTRAAKSTETVAKPEETETPPVEHKFETPPHPAYTPPVAHSSPFDNLGELPDSYGTGRLFLTARDPHWLYAYWDYSWQQLEEFRRNAQNAELKLRIHGGSDARAPIQQEITVTNSTRSWCVHVDQPNTLFYSEFGYYNHEGQFIVTSRSRPAKTPSDRLSNNTEARFVTIPFHITFRELFEIVKGQFNDGEELLDVICRLQAAGFKFPFDYESSEWDGSLEELQSVFGKDFFRRIRMGSEELTEWFRRRLLEETSSGLFSGSSPFGSSFGAPRSFWFNVNAELIVYGATDPEARVVFDGKEIALKPDGTFRFQFSLPNGKFHIPISATSPDLKETRSAELSFTRQTSKNGDVGAVPHPPELKPPNGEILEKA